MPGKQPIVQLEVPLDKLEAVYKAVDPNLEGGSRESQNFFEQQNPATRKLVAVVKESYKAMSEAMAAEIRDVLNAPKKGT